VIYMQKRASDLLGFRCSFLSFRCCAIYISITAWNCDFSRFLPDFEPFVLVSPDFWICGLYKYTVVCKDGFINEQGLGTLYGPEVVVPAQSALIMYK